MILCYPVFPLRQLWARSSLSTETTHKMGQCELSRADSMDTTMVYKIFSGICSKHSVRVLKG
jgi:hypothetical protein